MKALTINRKGGNKIDNEETLEKLEHKYFMLEMQDTWTSEDYRYSEELREKIRKLKGKEHGI